jgi:hypothetical protein
MVLIVVLEPCRQLGQGSLSVRTFVNIDVGALESLNERFVTASRRISFLQDLLVQNTLEFTHPLLQRQHLRPGEHLIVCPHGFVPALGHSRLPKDQVGRNTITTDYIGNHHPRLGGFLQKGRLLIERITPTTLDTGEDFHSTGMA